MKLVFRFFSNLKHYIGFLSLNMLSNVLYVLFSFFSFAMVAPFLSVIFGITESSPTMPVFKFNTDTLLQYIYYFVGQIQEQQGSFLALVYVAAGFFSLTILANLFRFLGLYFLCPIRAGMVRDLRNDFFKRIMNLPLSYFSEQRKGDLLSRLTSDMGEIEWAVVTSIQSFFKDPLYVVIFLCALLSINLPLTLIIIFVLPFVVWFIAFIGKKLKKESDTGQALMGSLLSLSEESISGVRVIKSFNLIDHVVGVFKHKNRLYTRILNVVHQRRDLANPLTETLLISILIAVLWFGGSQVLDEQLSADRLILFVLLFSRLISPAKSTVNAFYNLQKGRAAMERIYKIIDEPDQLTQKANPILKADFLNEINYEHVFFRYPLSEKNVLEDINIKIEKGKTYALVGASGSGKTTTVDLLSRFYETGTGRITVDGCDIRDLKVSDLRNLIGMVTQNPFVWNDTVENNIRFGGTYSTDEVIEAAKKANAHEFISAMAEGYQSCIVDRGNNLSGGQRQRIVIARAILKNAPILVLDEATSALDTESELLVQQALIKLMQDRTSIVIAHRLSTIQHADCIFVFDNGRIVEKGTHKELLQIGGVYANLVNLQNIE